MCAIFFISVTFMIFYFRTILFNFRTSCIFQNNIWKFFKLYKTAFMLASEKGYCEIANLLHLQKD